MKTEKRLLGDIGEDAAASYLKKNHYRIRERNFVSGKNEIDIIAENREYIVFVEVKTRTYREKNIERFGSPRLAVDARKRRCVIAAASHYFSALKQKKRIRFDVIEVYLTDEATPKVQDIHHIPDAFRT